MNYEQVKRRLEAAKTKLTQLETKAAMLTQGIDGLPESPTKKDVEKLQKKVAAELTEARNESAEIAESMGEALKNIEEELGLA